MTATPPSLGRERLADFSLDPTLTHLNHGGYGAVPKVIAAAAELIRTEAEADPTGFFALDRLQPRLLAVRQQIAAWLGGNAEDWALVENATMGANTVLAALGLQSGEEILGTSHIYNALRQTLCHHAELTGARYRELTIPLPYPGDEAFLEQIAQTLTPRTRLVVLDHITSGAATVLPLAQLIPVIKAAGARVLIDGAHAPGQIEIHVPSLGADWYVGNLHKWAFAPRGCGVLYAAEDARERLHPTAISHLYGTGFPREFDWIGTRDLSPWLIAGAGIDYHSHLGGKHLMRRNKALADDATLFLTQALGGGATAPPEARAAMSAIQLPSHLPASLESASLLMNKLRKEAQIIAPIIPLGEKLWLRISAQCYNAMEDYQRLGVYLPQLTRRQ